MRLLRLFRSETTRLMLLGFLASTAAIGVVHVAHAEQNEAPTSAPANAAQPTR